MSHDQAKKQLEAGTPPELVCAACPWDRLCVEPPAMSKAEVDAAIADAERKDKVRADGAGPNSSSFPVGTLMTAMVMAGKDTMGRLCPVFALRLRSPDGRQIADGLRQQMRTFDENPERS